MLLSEKFQFFGINGKCCTESLFTNYIMDIFPISGRISKNSFTKQQAQGQFFKMVVDNFLKNTEGGDTLYLSRFIKFAIDYSHEFNEIMDFEIWTICAIFVWASPTDPQEVFYSALIANLSRLLSI